jgi:hypothetical protein
MSERVLSQRQTSRSQSASVLALRSEETTISGTAAKLSGSSCGGNGHNGVMPDARRLGDGTGGFDTEEALPSAICARCWAQNGQEHRAADCWLMGISQALSETMQQGHLVYQYSVHPPGYRHLLRKPVPYIRAISHNSGSLGTAKRMRGSASFPSLVKCKHKVGQCGPG